MIYKNGHALTLMSLSNDPQIGQKNCDAIKAVLAENGYLFDLLCEIRHTCHVHASETEALKKISDLVMQFDAS